MTSEFDSEEIRLVPYSGEWVKKYEAEKARLAQTLAPYSYELAHIGSTAVPDLPAKGIVDIALRLENLDVLQELIPLLEDLEYRYFGEFGLPGREYFTKGKPREYNLHVVDKSSDHWERWIVFRDTLRNEEGIREDYLKLKKDLAGRYRFERSKYTYGKSEFIDSVLKDRLPKRNR